MDDVIYKQKAIDELWDMYSKVDDDGYMWVIRIDAVKRIEAMPSAQKKGHWVENHDSDHAWRCSECGCGYTDSKLSFCYDCGADMRGEDGG